MKVFLFNAPATLLLGSIFLTTSLPAATIVVNNTADAAAANPAVSADSTLGAGVITIRSAIQRANALAGADIITLPAGTYTLTRVGNDSTCVNGDLDINGSLTINGAGAGTTFIQGASDAAFTGSIGDKVIGINQDGTFTNLTVMISDITIRYGRNTIASGDPTFAYTGAGVDVFLTGFGNNITLSNCVIANNEHVTSYGGGVNVDSGASGLPGDTLSNVGNRGTVSFISCVITNNRTLSTVNVATGGGLNLFSDIHNVILTNCVIANNHTPTNGPSGGGGINMRHSFGGTITVQNCTITNNQTGGGGGGILVAFNQNITVTGGTISGNTSFGSGGSSSGGGFLYNANILSSGPLTCVLTNVTISNNHADIGAAAQGGGVYVSANSPLNIRNCTITGNTSRQGAGIGHVSGALTNSGSIIAGNVASADGGGLGVFAATATNITTGVSITNNQAAASGGGIYVSGGTLNATFCRIVNNTATTGKAAAQTAGTASVTNNWWGTNTPAALMSGTVGFTPSLQLTHTASPNQIFVPNSTTLTASFLTNSAGSTISVANLGLLIGLPITFNNAVRGTLSGAQTTIQASGTATATFTANIAGAGSADATVDSGTATASITIPTGVSSINRVQTSPTNLASVQWTVTFSNAVSGVAAGNFSLVNSGLGGSPAISSVVAVGGSPATSWTVTASTGSGSGTLGLNMANGTGVSASIANLPFTGQAYTIDLVTPTVTCSSNITVTANGNCPAVVNFTVSVSDNLALASSTTNPASGSTFPVGTNTVTLTAKDTAGNTNFCTFKVTVVAGAAPQLNIVRSGTNVVVSWTNLFGCYALQTAPVLASNSWSLYPGPFATNGGNICVTNSATLTNRFYRLSF